MNFKLSTEEPDHVRDDKCPLCGHELDSATSIEDESLRPQEGDLTVCIKCAGLLKFGPRMKLQRLTVEEWDALDDETRHGLSRAKHAIETVRARH